MLYACVERFDVMGGRGNILGWEEEVNKATITIYSTIFFFSYSIICLAFSIFSDYLRSVTASNLFFIFVFISLLFLISSFCFFFSFFSSFVFSGILGLFHVLSLIILHVIFVFLILSCFFL
jgi:hypothetical protein